jgi:hypothetical protein
MTVPIGEIQNAIRGLDLVAEEVAEVAFEVE